MSPAELEEHLDRLGTHRNDIQARIERMEQQDTTDARELNRRIALRDRLEALQEQGRRIQQRKQTE